MCVRERIGGRLLHRWQCLALFSNLVFLSCCHVGMSKEILFGRTRRLDSSLRLPGLCRSPLASPNCHDLPSKEKNLDFVKRTKNYMYVKLMTKFYVFGLEEG